MTSPPAEPSGDTRDRVLAVAAQLFAEHGFDAVSVAAEPSRRAAEPSRRAPEASS